MASTMEVESVHWRGGFAEKRGRVKSNEGHPCTVLRTKVDGVPSIGQLPVKKSLDSLFLALSPLLFSTSPRNYRLSSSPSPSLSSVSTVLL